MTPEVVLTGFVGGQRECEMAEPIPGPACEYFAELAKELGIYILVGLSELCDGEIMNAMPVLSPQGILMGTMHKVHITATRRRAAGAMARPFPSGILRRRRGPFAAAL